MNCQSSPESRLFPAPKPAWIGLPSIDIRAGTLIQIPSGSPNDNLVIFKRDPETGALTPTSRSAEVGSPVCVSIWSLHLETRQEGQIGETAYEMLIKENLTQCAYFSAPRK
jgi:Lactonase, 7-bladed beta-propeller